jgi:anti-sigma factor RsiW
MDHQEVLSTLASERYLLGEMTDTERDSFEEHFFSCAECAEDVTVGETMRAGAHAGLIGAPRASQAPGRGSKASVLSWRAWRPAMVIPWAAAATLALVAGYQSMQMQNGRTPSIGPLALSPMTVRAATRGQEPVVSPGPGGVVTLAVDLGADRFEGGVQYELSRVDQTRIATGQVAAPAPGAPLLMMFPAGLLKPNERYVLVMRNSGNAGLTREEYRFRVEAP